MAIETFPENDLVLSRGRLYFALYDSATGAYGAERYLGSTPTVTLERSQETLDHFSTEEGLRVKDKSVTLQDDMTITFAVENMTARNIAMFFYNDPELSTQTTVTGATDTIAEVELDGHYQLGVDDDYPSGKRGVSNVVVTKGATTIDAAGNYEVDLALGRIHFLADAADVIAGDNLTVTYDVAATPRTVVVDSSNVIEGSLRFIAANAVGSNKDFYIPYVKLSADGQFALKGEEWQQVAFRGEILKLGTKPRVVLDNR